MLKIWIAFAILPSVCLADDKNLNSDEAQEIVNKFNKLPATLDVEITPPQQGCNLPTTQSPSKQERVVQEFLTAEASYVDQLKLMTEPNAEGDTFLGELLNPRTILGGKGPDDTRLALFALNELNHAHTLFLRKITQPSAAKDRLKVITKSTFTGDQMEPNHVNFPAPGMAEAYRTYVPRLKNLQTALQKVDQKKLKALFEKYQLGKNLAGQTESNFVNSLLVVPFQRMQKYPLLLRELVQSQPPGTPPDQTIAKTLDRTTLMVSAVNRHMRLREDKDFADRETQLRMVDLRKTQKANARLPQVDPDQPLEEQIKSQKKKNMELKEIEEKLQKKRDSLVQELDQLTLQDFKEEKDRQLKALKKGNKIEDPDQEYFYYKKLLKRE